MPAKSQHGRRKHLPQGKKRKGLSQPAAVAQRPASGPSQKAATQPISPVTPTRTPRPGAPRIEEPKIRDPYVRTELRNIAILTGIMVIIIVVLALVLT